MSYALVISRDAALDIEEARRWLRQPGAGRRAAERLQQIRKVIRDLRNGPALWPIGHHPGVREASAGGYRILYTATRKESGFGFSRECLRDSFVACQG